MEQDQGACHFAANYGYQFFRLLGRPGRYNLKNDSRLQGVSASRAAGLNFTDDPIFCSFIDQVLDSDFFKKDDIKDLGYDPTTTAGKADMDMAELQREREAQGLPPD